MGSIVTPSMTSAQKVEPGSCQVHTASLPASSIHTSESPAAIAEQWVSQFNTVFEQGDWSSVSQLFLDNCYWRDHLCLSWDLHTLRNPKAIIRFLESGNGQPAIKSAAVDFSQPHRVPSLTTIDFLGNVHCIQFWLNIDTVVGKAQGIAKVVSDADSKWKAYTLFTTLREIRGHEESTGQSRPVGADHGGRLGRSNWEDRRKTEMEFHMADPTVLIVGAGQGGLTCAARLRQLGISTLIVDQNDRVGDNWRRRYHQLVLHDPVWYDHMPYLEFPSNWPVFTPKDKLAEWFEAYVKIMELSVWNSTTVVESDWSDMTKLWTVKLKSWKDGVESYRTLHTKHIIQATGHSGEKNFPEIKGMKDFKGDRLCHSSEFPGADSNGRGKKAVVIGCCNSAHDIAQDFYEKGYDVTMIQRSTTAVITSKSVLEVLLGGLYKEGGVPVDDADILSMGIPYAVLKRIHIDLHNEVKIRDKDTRKGLVAAGFALDDGPDGSGFFMKYIQRGGGYYIDVGASQLIADGKIKVVQGHEISTINKQSLTLDDGVDLEADEIIFATGYQNMRSSARRIFGDKIADELKSVWGLDEEGEMRAIWKRSGHPGFWFMGGNLAMSRYHSRLLALQIKAQELGLMRKDG